MRFATRTLRLTAAAGLAAMSLPAVAPDPQLAPATVPQILDVQFAPQQLKAGSDFNVVIHTTPDVTTLQAHVMKYTVPVPKTGDGQFSATGRVPWWARIYHGTFKVTFVGIDASGDQTQMETDVHI